MENVTKDYCSKETSVQNLDKIPNVGSSAKMDESKSHSKKSDSIKEKPLPGLLFLKQSFRTLSVPKKSTDKGQCTIYQFYIMITIKFFLTNH